MTARSHDPTSPFDKVRDVYTCPAGRRSVSAWQALDDLRQWLG